MQVAVMYKNYEGLLILEEINNARQTYLWKNAAIMRLAEVLKVINYIFMKNRKW